MDDEYALCKINITNLGTDLTVIDNSFADRMTIKGRPVEPILHRHFYKLPTNYYPANTGFHFLSILDVPRICFMQQRRQFAPLDMIYIVLEEGYQKKRWYCYSYDPRYFEIDY
jgi:hypothetical protein